METLIPLSLATSTLAQIGAGLSAPGMVAIVVIVLGVVMFFDLMEFIKELMFRGSTGISPEEKKWAQYYQIYGTADEQNIASDKIEGNIRARRRINKVRSGGFDSRERKTYF